MSDFAAAHQNMVDSQIRPHAVTDRRLLQALYTVDRTAFVPPAQHPLAYMDAPLQIEVASADRLARYLPAPGVFARLAQLAGVRPEDKVLDIGCATGYSTAIFAHLAQSVVAVESDAGLAALARDTLAELRLKNAEVHNGPLETGAPDKGPFQVISVNGRLPRKPEASVDTPAHRALIRREVAEGSVLLKNHGFLPLAAGRGLRIAAIGPNAADVHLDQDTQARDGCGLILA
ncbi:MAG: methyltransferase domain-containing protein, partial [Alphaproteobacteria bacterium]